MAKKVRIDLLLVEKGLVESRSLAQRLVMAGQVRANGQMVPKPASKVPPDAQLTIDGGARFVSRGGEKLEAAFSAFDLNVAGKTCADVGASTGGFTDCLLQHGAVKVYAIDVGKGILHWKLRQDSRVVVMEETNARFVEKLPESVDFISMDASFISLKVLLPVVKSWLSSPSPPPTALMGTPLPLSQLGEGEVIALIKPQFEAGRREAARGKGVIRDPKIHHNVLIEILSFAEDDGFHVGGLVRSPVVGPKGNHEFLVWLGLGKNEMPALEWRDVVPVVVPLDEDN